MSRRRGQYRDRPRRPGRMIWYGTLGILWLCLLFWILVLLAAVPARSLERSASRPDVLSRDAGRASALPDDSAPYVPQHDGEDLSTLEMVIEVCRHGARAPLSTYPNDPRPYTRWPVGPGELTLYGAHRQYQLGQHMRAEYGQVIPQRYQVREVYIRSSNINRALMSAYAQAAGLFAADEAYTRGDEQRPGGLPGGWQAVPIHSDAIEHDHVMLPANGCPRWEALQRARQQSSEWAAQEREHAEFLDRLGRDVLGLSRPATLADADNAFDVWQCDDAEGIVLPANVTAAVRQQVERLYQWLFIGMYRGTEQARLSGGSLAHQLLTLLQQRAAGQRFERFALFSGHDTTLLALLSVLGALPKASPSFNATVILELHRRDPGDRWYVTARYDWKPLTVPGCAPECPLPQLARILKPLLVDPHDATTWNRLCRVRGDSWLDRVASGATSGGLQPLLLLLLAVLVVLLPLSFLLGKRYARVRATPTYQQL
ncbi:hypothetical protein CDCA_CDCA20G4762 [Cyanidium caldarium]|uniref:Acid phosphatase n=1 Tax=Cyanidium caldarium TaxID=2771 RepID=A0AAV9J2D2_CYACA|nr:hypothetical protein CDCA_CDCA20G4762 [Cyanidium caldarium]